MTTAREMPTSSRGAGAGDGAPGTTKIAPDVVAAIAGHVAASVDGVTRLGTANVLRSMADAVGSDSSTRGRGVTVEAGEREAIVDIQMTVEYGHSIPDIVRNVRTRVAESLRDQVGLAAKQINIQVVAIDFPEDATRRVE